MLQDLASLQLFYFKHPHDTKEFAIFFRLAKIHRQQQFHFSHFFFFCCCLFVRLTLWLQEGARQRGWAAGQGWLRVRSMLPSMQ